MHIFYTPDIENNEYYTLKEEESKHCVRVLRLQKNDVVQLIDGKGSLYTARIVSVEAKKCQVAIESFIKDYNERNINLHIAIAPTKNNDRFEWFLEKATEIGIDEITPIICEHSERKIVKNDRLEKVVIAAIKQSVIAKKPVINSQTVFSEFIKKSKSLNCEKYIAHCDEGDRKSFSNLYVKGKDTLILIGPEGDFSTKEIETAIQNSFQPVTLGKNRLRTETAGIVACEIINFMNE